jgi:hypothetical protein
MKRTLINLGCILIGIVLAVVIMKLTGATRDSEPDAEATTPAKAAVAKPAISPSPRTASRVDRPATQVEPFDNGSGETPGMTSTASDAVRLKQLMNRVFSGQATEEEALAFFEQMRNSEVINEIIAEQERKTPLESDDIPAHMNMAQLYVAKLYSSSVGPEMGFWAGKAEQRWRQVLELDPGHLDAQYQLAFSLSQYPDFLNRTGEAIREYEKVVELQRNLEPQPHQARAYLELFRLYQKRGDQANAYDAIREGLERFPDNEQLIEQRNSISTLQ